MAARWAELHHRWVRVSICVSVSVSVLPERQIQVQMLQLGG